MSNKYQKLKNWNQKTDPILKLRDVNVCSFEEKNKEGRNIQKVE